MNAGRLIATELDPGSYPSSGEDCAPFRSIPLTRPEKA